MGFKLLKFKKVNELDRRMDKKDSSMVKYMYKVYIGEELNALETNRIKTAIYDIMNNRGYGSNMFCRFEELMNSCDSCPYYDVCTVSWGVGVK